MSTTIYLIGLGILLLVFICPGIFPGRPKERTCPHCRKKMDYRAKVCPSCERRSEKGFGDTARGIIHQFLWFAAIMAILIVLNLLGIIHI